MNNLTLLFRVIYINFVLLRHRLDNLVFSIPLFAPLRFLVYVNPMNWGRAQPKPNGENVRKALQDLGPVFVKFGQMLSTRRDLLSDDVADELALLQDRVPPFSSERARQIIEENYGASIENLFTDFNATPIASASIAQVHAARLTDGKDVVIKVKRPNIEKTIYRDVALLKLLAKIAERFWADGARLRPVDVVKEFEQVICAELDFQQEAANASLLRRNFKDSNKLYVPEVFWSYVKRDVLVFERIHGIPISDIETLKKRGVNLKKLAETGVEIFFTQFLEHSFFHADMHPGNIFVDEGHLDNPSYIAVDFGIMGTLNAKDKRYLAENLQAFFKRDYARVAELHIESGWVPYDTRPDAFEAAIRAVSEPIFEKPLKDISFGHMLLRLFQTARQFNMEVQPQLVLLQKTLLSIEGLGRDLYPDLDLWNTAKPFIEKWLKSQMGVRALIKGIQQNSPLWLEKFPEVPVLLYDTLQFFHNQRLSHPTKVQEMVKQRKQNKRRCFRAWLNGVGVTVIALLVGHYIWQDMAITQPITEKSLAWGLAGVAAVCLLWARIANRD